MDLDPTAPQQQIIAAINNSKPKPLPKPVSPAKHVVKRKNRRLSLKNERQEKKIKSHKRTIDRLNVQLKNISKWVRVEKKASNNLIQETIKNTNHTLEEAYVQIEEAKAKREECEKELMKVKQQAVKQVRNERQYASESLAVADANKKNEVVKAEEKLSKVVNEQRKAFDRAKVITYPYCYYSPPLSLDLTFPSPIVFPPHAILGWLAEEAKEGKG